MKHTLRCGAVQLLSVRALKMVGGIQRWIFRNGEAARRRALTSPSQVLERLDALVDEGMPYKIIVFAWGTPSIPGYEDKVVYCSGLASANSLQLQLSSSQSGVDTTQRVEGDKIDDVVL